MLKLSASIVALHCLLAVPATAQTDLAAAFSQPQSQLQSQSSCSGDVRSCLKQYNISLTKEALLSALHSDDSKIWPLAAEELAFEGVKDTIPQLAALLEAKPNPADKITLADALAQLGDERGVEILKRYCDDSGAPMSSRLSAAWRLLRYQPKSCPKTLIEGLQDNTCRFQALVIVPYFRELSPSESAMVEAILLKSLNDQDFMVRLQTAETIEGSSDKAFAINALHAAIPRESNPEVRSAMEDGLHRLQDKQQAATTETAP